MQLNSQIALAGLRGDVNTLLTLAQAHGKDLQVATAIGILTRITRAVGTDPVAFEKVDSDPRLRAIGLVFFNFLKRNPVV
jgi:hypothetical protein